VEKGAGIQPTNVKLARVYRTTAKHPPFLFEALTQYHLILKAQAVCLDDGHRLYGAASESTHLHMVVSWRDELLAYSKVRGRMKNLTSLDLSRRAGLTGRPWFSDGASRKRVGGFETIALLARQVFAKTLGSGVV
jgi:hypothetical protein